MAGTLPSPGDVIAGRFRLEVEIGRGGMGAVLRARDPSNNVVAVKVLLPEVVGNPDAVPRFLNEGRASRELVSEHAVRVFEVGTLDGGLPFMVMELLDGVDLATMLEQRGPLPITEACDAIIDACHALAEAHARGMVHRDLKPANLFAAKRPDGSPCIKVLDFGLSKIASQMRHAALTSTGAFLGSPHYMAPEQLKSAKGVDSRADIWSLGVVLYELITNKMPFDGKTFGQLFMEIVSQEPTPVARHRPDIPPGLVEIIERCMKKDREQRYSEVATVAKALASFASPKGVSEAQRIVASGPPRAPLSSVPEISVDARSSSPDLRPSRTSKLGGTMLMANAPQVARPQVAAHAPAPPAHSGAMLTPPVAPLPAPPLPSAAVPRPSSTEEQARALSPARVITIVAVFVVLALVGLLLAMIRLRSH